MSFELQPILKGDLLELRPLAESDWAELFAAASDPLIWEQHPSNDLYQETAFASFFQECLNSKAQLVVMDRKSECIIGTSRYIGYDGEKSEIEIGWTFLARSYWGGKFNGEMKRLMLKHAFKFVDNAIFMVGIDNIRSRKAVERIGATYLETRPNSLGHESHVYRVEKGSYKGV